MIKIWKFLKQITSTYTACRERIDSISSYKEEPWIGLILSSNKKIKKNIKMIDE